MGKIKTIKRGFGRTVKAKIMLYSAVLTMGLLAAVVLNIVIQINQTGDNIRTMLNSNLTSGVSIVNNGLNNLNILLNDHAHDYQFVSGTAEEKTAHANAINDYDESINTLVYIDAAGNSYGGTLPDEVKNTLMSAGAVLTSSDSPEGTFFIGMKIDDGSALAAELKASKLSGILSGLPGEALLLSDNGTVIASSNGSGGSYPDYVRPSEERFVNARPSGEASGVRTASVGLSNGWTLMIKEDCSEYNNGFYVTAIFDAALIVVIVVLGILANGYFSRKVTRPLSKIGEKVVQMSNGILSGENVNYTANDELGDLSKAVDTLSETNQNIIGDLRYTAEGIAEKNLCVKPKAEYVGDFIPIKNALESIVESVRDVVAHIEAAAKDVSSSSVQMSSNSNLLSQAATEEADIVTRLNTDLDSVYHRINSSADNASTARSIADESKNLVNEGNEKMSQMLKAMNDINATSAEIANIIKTIQDISFQTNILSLNASIEAARAGEAGKGFAVVAGEVGNLANKTAEAAKSTTGLIETAIEAVKHGTVIANETAEMLEKIVDKTDSTSQVIGDIADASAEQAESVKQVLTGMNSISAAVTQISTSAEECAQSSEELSAQAAILYDTIDKFVIEESAENESVKNTEQKAPAKAAEIAAEKTEPVPAAKKETAAVSKPDGDKKPREKTVKKPESKPASKPETKAAEKPEEKTSEKTAAKPAEKTASKPVEKPAAKPAAKKADKTAVKKPAPSAKKETVTVSGGKTSAVSAAEEDSVKPADVKTVSKATAVPVKRTIHLDDDKY